VRLVLLFGGANGITA